MTKKDEACCQHVISEALLAVRIQQWDQVGLTGCQVQQKQLLESQNFERTSKISRL